MRRSSLAAGGVELAVQPGQLGGEQLVVWGGRVDGDGLFPGEEQGRAEQRVADLAEDELVEGVGADVALGAAAGPARRRAAGRGCGSSSTGARCRCGRASCGSLCPRRRARTDQAA